MNRHPVDPGRYLGPVVRVEISQPPDLISLFARREGGPPAQTRIVCWGVIDTGASHTAVDIERVAQPLGLVPVDFHEVLPAGAKKAVSVNTFWGSIRCPDFPFAAREQQLVGMDLAGPFYVLIGMDMLEGTRFTYDGRERWFSWEPSAPAA